MLGRADQPTPAPSEAFRWFPIADQTAWSEAARRDPIAYWAARARNVAWDLEPSATFSGRIGEAHWFAGGRLNVTISCLDRHAQTHPDSIAFDYLCEDGSSRSITYAGLLADVNRLANALAADGVRQGDRVCIYLPLSIEGIVAMLACARLGAIHCVVFAGLGVAALRARIDDVAAEVVLAADTAYRRGKKIDLESTVAEATASLDFVRRVVIWRRSGDSQPSAAPLRESEAPGAIAHDAAPPDSRLRDWKAYQKGYSTERSATIVGAEHPLFILHTSGTEGKPKGIVHVHGGYLVGAASIFAEITGLTPDDVLWCTSDLGWMTAHTQTVYGVLANRLRCVIREGAPDFPSVGTTYALIERYAVTQIYMAPTFARILRGCGDEPARRHDLSSLRAIYCGGEPLDPGTGRFLHDVIGKGRVAVCEHWGQTETGAPSLGYLPTSEIHPGRTGQPFGPLEFDVEDGELVATVPWPHLFAGVWNDPEAYACYFSSGHYRTGDVAIRDSDGFFSIAGRADDVIKTSGHRLSPAEIEGVFNAHPDCIEAAAIGIPDERGGEALKVFVVLRAGAQGDQALRDALGAHVRRQLGPIAVPDSIEFVAALPKTRSGKIMRRVLKARESGRDPGDLTTLEV